MRAAPFADWLARVLTGGASVQDDPPAASPAAVPLLREAFETHALDVPGPPLPFDEGAALAAAALLARACWCLVSDESPGLHLDVPPSPAAHLSADVTLHFLPTVHRRAKLRAPDGVLTLAIERVLCAWPLSGVLADLAAPPTTPPLFEGHAGLQLLYAERLLATGRPGWVPPAGSAREWAERVFLERGRPLPMTPPKEDDRA